MTPLLKISDKIYAKLETYQPTGSVKDRMVSYLVDNGLEDGSIIPGKTKFIEATSGNTGISLAAQAARLNCKCTIVMPKNMSKQRKQMMRAFGAHIIEVGDNDFSGAITLRDTLMKNDNSKLKNSTWCPRQFTNPLNIECHHKVTAKEIFYQLNEVKKNASAFVHGAGTGGTMMGIKQYIDEHKLATKCVLTTPAEASDKHGIQGINDGADFLLDKSLMDHVVSVKTVDAVLRMKRFALETGLLVGISSGANIIAAEIYAQNFKPDGIIITMLCDRGERYL